MFTSCSIQTISDEFEQIGKGLKEDWESIKRGDFLKPRRKE